MPHIKFTDRALQTAKLLPGEPTTRYWDEEATGLMLNVGLKGKTFYAFTPKGNIKIGRYPGWTIIEARKKCQQIRRDVDDGLDPQPKKLPTFREAFGQFEVIRLGKRRPSSTARIPPAD